MAKRLIDTELWNNADIIENFTAEDRYFWVYLLTNPHINICGVMKSNAILIARDMGYSKESVENLLYRFENVHKSIKIDKETKELIVLNWSKFNWNKSRDILKTVESNTEKVSSEAIRHILLQKVDMYLWSDKDKGDRVYTVCVQDTNTNTIPNIDNNNIYNNISDNENDKEIDNKTITTDNEMIKSDNTNDKRMIKNDKIDKISNAEIDNYFDKTWLLYPRKVNKINAKKYYANKMVGLEKDSAKKVANAIYIGLENQIRLWAEENNGEGRKIDFIPHFSSWLNANIEDSKNKGRK